MSVLSFLSTEFGPTSVSDSAIQILTPQGVALFNWNSWDHMALEDCTQHRFPILYPGSPASISPDYAHLNSMQLVDGKIIGSFRGCAKVLAIDAVTGDVAWRLGHSNLSEQEWADRDIGPHPMGIAGDPKRQFCGQHSAKRLPNGNLLLYDNGVACLINPETYEQVIPTVKKYSRAVEYSMDHANHEAVFVREHSLRGAKTHTAWSSGQVEQLDNGDWLISWGRGEHGNLMPDNETITQVDPATGEEKFAVRFTYSDVENRPRIAANTLPPQALEPAPRTPERRHIRPQSYPGVPHRDL